MIIKQVNGRDSDFYRLCKQLENHQYKLLPNIKEKGYNLTDDLSEVIGYILYDNDTPIGSIGLKKVTDTRCEFVRVFVAENHRGKGYATTLFQNIESLAKSLGYTDAEIVAWCKAVPAVNLYKKLGYQASEEKTSTWYGGDKYIELKKKL